MDFMRSLMFVPGSKQKMIDKAMGLANLDVAMFDIEDGVVPPEKPLARQQIVASLGRPRQAGEPARFVRVNAPGSGPDRIEADLRAVIVPGLDGLVVPKVENAEQVQQVDRVLGEKEAQAGLARGSVRLIAAIETARGLVNAASIAASSPRTAGLIFGAEDYALDLGLPSNREGEARQLLFARSSLVNSAATAHVGCFDGVWPEIQDFEGCETDAIQARRLGFSGKSTFHPGQIDIINRVFSPTDAEVDYARRVVQAFDDAVERGDGAVAFGGQLLDLPIVERARRTLSMKEALASGKSASALS